MGINSTSPPAPPQKFVVIGSGSYTTTGVNVIEEAGNFSTPGDLSNGTLVIEINYGTSDGANGYMGFDFALGASVASQVTTGTGIKWYSMKFKKDPQNPTTNANMLWNNILTLTNTSLNVNLGQATTFYLKAFKTSTGNLKCNWIAYIIKP